MSALPATSLQTKIKNVWSEVLGIDEVELDDNFFDVGGHSLALAEVHERLRAAIGHDLSLLDLYRWPTIAELASQLECRSAETAQQPSSSRELRAHMQELIKERRQG
jgi:aryl carrier-like protein